MLCLSSLLSSMRAVANKTILVISLIRGVILIRSIICVDFDPNSIYTILLSSMRAVWYNVFMNKSRKINSVKMSLVAKDWSEKLWSNVTVKLAKAKSPKEVENILEKLISEDEKASMMRRLAAIVLIRAGYSYRKISEILWLSHNTISTLKKNLIGAYKNYKSYLAFYGGPRKYSGGDIKIEKSFWDGLFVGDIDLWELIKNPLRPPGIGLKNRSAPRRSH